jgi:hypothetical protein
MPEYVVVRDSRLEGVMPGVFTAWWNDLNIISTSKANPLQDVFDQVNELNEEHGKMHTMFVLCHGYAGGSENLMMSGDFGGQGLQLGTENVLHSNVSAWEEIKDTVSNIVVYACAAANTEAGNEFTTEDGEYLMGALAIHTNAVVYAADRMQWYMPGDFNFGQWEGRLLRFNPSGEPPEEVSEVPVGFNELT